MSARRKVAPSCPEPPPRPHGEPVAPSLVEHLRAECEDGAMYRTRTVRTVYFGEAVRIEVPSFDHRDAACRAALARLQDVTAEPLFEVGAVRVEVEGDDGAVLTGTVRLDIRVVLSKATASDGREDARIARQAARATAADVTVDAERLRQAEAERDERKEAADAR